MRRSLFFLFVIWVCGSASAEVTPLEVPLGEMVENIACFSNPTQTYTLYVPSNFNNDRRWPVLLIFDPRGRSLLAAELFRDAAETYGWIIVSSDNTRSDGPMEPNTIALQALWPEIHERIPTDFDRIYAAGFSGGAIVANVLSKATGELAGIIACGGRHVPEQLENNDVAIFATAGDLDFNHREMHLLDEFLARQGNLHRLVIFDGPHTWMPPALAREAVEWFELIAMQRGLRQIDPELVSSLLTVDMAEAEAFAAERRAVDASKRYREILQTYEGLADTSLALDRTKEIEATSGFRDQTKLRKKSRSWERRCDEGVNNGLSALRSSDMPAPLSQLAREFRIDELQERAELGNAMGFAAQRCLNGLYTGFSFYLPRDFAAERRYAHAVTAYELAVMIRDDNPVVWYNLACVRALLGQRSTAVEALAKSLEHGFNRYELLETDTDLDPLRKRDDFKALMASIPVR